MTSAALPRWYALDASRATTAKSGSDSEPSAERERAARPHPVALAIDAEHEPSVEPGDRLVEREPVQVLRLDLERHAGKQRVHTLS